MPTDTYASYATTAIILADTTDYALTATWGTRTHQFNLENIAAAAARQSVSVDLALSGDLLAPLYAVHSVMETGGTAPTGTTGWNFYFGASMQTASGFPGALSGTDSAYTGINSSLAAGLAQLTHVGYHNQPPTTINTVSYAFLGFYVPSARYIRVVGVNNTAQTNDTGAENMGVKIIPVFPQAQ